MTIHAKDLGKIGIAILVVIIILIVNSLCSCSTKQCLTEPFIGDRLITSIDTTSILRLENWKFQVVERRVIHTVNNFGHEFNIYVNEKDSVNYTAGNILIFER